VPVFWDSEDVTATLDSLDGILFQGGDPDLVIEGKFSPFQLAANKILD